MQTKKILAILGIVIISTFSHVNGQVVIKIIPPQLDDMLISKNLEFQIINKQRNEMDINLQLEVKNDTNSCILINDSCNMKLYGRQNIIINWDTLCIDREDNYFELVHLEEGIYTVSIIASKKNSTETIGSDYLQIFYKK